MMKLPTYLEGLTVREPTDEETVRISEETGELPGELSRFFILEGTGYEGYVVAGAMATHEDEADYADPSSLLVND